MLIGNESRFAIDSQLSEKNLSHSQIGIGYFNIILANHRFGIHEIDATVLGCSYKNVVNCLQMRNKHVAPFSEINDPHCIAKNLRDVLYINGDKGGPVFGLSRRSVINLVYKNKLLFAPDGDEAFDDGSYVIHFDIGPEVRLIGFMSGNGEFYEESTLVDVRLSANEFYGIIESWRLGFEKEVGIQ